MKIRTSDVFRAAKGHIAIDMRDRLINKKATRICYAISDVASRMRSIENRLVADRARGIVQSRIKPFTLLEDWLMANGVPRADVFIWSERPLSRRAERSAHERYENMQAYRLAWLDKLIEEFTMKGD